MNAILKTLFENYSETWVIIRPPTTSVLKNKKVISNRLNDYSNLLESRVRVAKERQNLSLVHLVLQILYLSLNVKPILKITLVLPQKNYSVEIKPSLMNLNIQNKHNV